jgi:hypothetical protein
LVALRGAIEVIAMSEDIACCRETTLGRMRVA